MHSNGKLSYNHFFSHHSKVTTAKKFCSASNSKILIVMFMLLTLLFVSNLAWSNVFDDIKADMLLNEALLLKAPSGAGWAKKANIGMGAVPRGDATPRWWQPDDKYYKSSAYWHAITPWFVIYPGTMHKASNVRVKLSDIRLYILKHSSNTWQQINVDTTDPTWVHHMSYVLQSTAGEKVNKRIELDGKVSYKLNAGLNPIHGGIHIYEIYGPDVKAVYAQLTSELILDDPNKTDDREQAQLLLSVGADYYPDTNSRVGEFTAPHNWVPAVAGSRFALIKRSPRVHHMATINPPGPINNGSSEFINSHKTISITEFEANPPLVE